jgi:hypothetical protein
LPDDDPAGSKHVAILPHNKQLLKIPVNKLSVKSPSDASLVRNGINHYTKENNIVRALITHILGSQKLNIK